MDRLLSVDTKELSIEYRPAQRCCSEPIRVTNLMHTMSVAVHVTTTRPADLIVSPSTSAVSVAVVPPLGSVAFSVYIPAAPKKIGGAGHPPPSICLAGADPFSLLIRSAPLPTGRADSASLLRLFSRPGVHVFRSAPIPISLVGPFVLDSLLSSDGGGGGVDSSRSIARAANACSASDLGVLLRRAAASCNNHLVCALLDAGADHSSRDPLDGRSPLGLAVSSGAAEAVSALLAAGARPDPAVDRLVHVAAASNRTAIMVLLAGACPEEGWAGFPDPAGRTPLHAAAAAGHLEAARLCVLSGGADPDLPDWEGWTPLHWAAAAGSSAVAEFLLSSSAYDARRALTLLGRKTSYDVAVEGGKEHMYDLLRPDDDGVGRSCCSGAAGEAVASWAAAAVDRADQNGWTPLHRAAFKGRLEVVRALVERGARLDAVDNAGYTPLRCAVEARQAEVALWLVGAGAALSGLKGLRGAESLLGAAAVAGQKGGGGCLPDSCCAASGGIYHAAAGGGGGIFDDSKAIEA